jgi:hypothetical protein
MPKGTTSKEGVETRSYGKKLFFMVKFPEVLGSATYIIMSKAKFEFGTKEMTLPTHVPKMWY